MNTQEVERANGIFELVTEYYRRELGANLQVPMRPTCFCKHDPSCGNRSDVPMTVPDVLNNCIQIHITSAISPNYYPSQLVYQYAHELWHAYEFDKYGVNYPWQTSMQLTEPYAHAASHCALSERFIPGHILPDAAQQSYFEAEKVSVPNDPMYIPGVKLAEEVGYSLQKLHSRYNAVVVPQIMSTLQPTSLMS